LAGFSGLGRGPPRQDLPLGTLGVEKGAGCMTIIDAALAGDRSRASGAVNPAHPGAVLQVADAAGSDATEAAPRAATSVGETAPVSLSVMLAAEALVRDATHDREARRRGRVVLAGLAALQRALLDGGAVAGTVERLARLIDDMPQAAEPWLAVLLGSIVLRARVELARLGR
jgi:hypothetical protein